MKKWLLRLLPWVITLLLLRFLISQGGDIQELRTVIATAQWWWLLLAVLLQAGAYGAVAWINELLLRCYGVMVPRFHQYIIQFSMAFIETVVPAAAISGLVLRVHLLRPYGATPDVAVVTTLIETVAISMSVVMPALLVFIFLFGESVLAGEVLWWLFAAVVVLAALVMLGVRQWRQGQLQRVFALATGGLARLWDEIRLKRFPQQLAEWPSSRIQERARYLIDELTPRLRVRLHWLALALITRTLCEAWAFIVCFYAFGVQLPLPMFFFLYTVTITLNTLGGIPGAVGFVETLLATTYLQVGLTPESALAVAMAYRLTGYWLPRIAGGLGWLWLERVQRRMPAPEGSNA